MYHQQRAEICTIENAKKELHEELNAVVIEKPIELGIITADSGLSSGSATVFLMRINEFCDLNEEGIRKIVTLTPDEIQQKVINGEIDDGYTFAALALYNTFITSCENIKLE